MKIFTQNTKAIVAKFTLLACILGAIISSCSTTPEDQGKIKKILKFRIRDKQNRGGEPMIRAEEKQYLYGAIGGQERKARYGDYFTFICKTKQKGSPLELTFVYRKENTGDKLSTQIIKTPSAKRKNVMRVSIIGDEFVNDGSVTAWKATLKENGQATGVARSYLWKD